MRQIPKIILDEAERQGGCRMAAYLCDIGGCAIYGLGVKDKEHWFPGSPNAPVLASLKDGVIEPYEGIGLIATLLKST